MLARIRSLLRQSWPFVGSLYLVYLALQPPPIRYVGVLGLVFVTPLLVGWVVGRVFDVGPWADDEGDHDVEEGELDGTEEEVERPVQQSVDDESA